MKKNIILNMDSYKTGHYRQLPDNTEGVYSYFESRNGSKYNKVLFFGLQYFIKEYLEGIVVTQEMIEDADKMCTGHFGAPNTFNRAMFEYIVKKHGGKLPIRINAVKEGTVVDVSNVLLTVENTDPLCFGLTNQLETLLSNIWGACTVATFSREVKLLCAQFLKDTGGNPAHLSFMLHDFGQRSTISPEAAAIAGAGHLVNFLGTDTMLAMQLADQYYGATMPCAFSVPATEHSVMTSLGPDGEFQIFESLLDKYPSGILSIVIDSYNYKQFIDVYACKLKDKILARNGKVVFRPDSGDPDDVTLSVLNLLNKVFGSTKNQAGYKQLNPKVGVLWGDGIGYDGIRSILYTMKAQGYAADNIVFGAGSALLQKHNRDSARFAFKSSAQKRDGVWYDVFKKPIDSSKASKHGRLKLVFENGKFETAREGERMDLPDQLETVFENGKLVRFQTFDEIRAIAKTFE
jgi:nicotinamide phosphoribosyltransferase